MDASVLFAVMMWLLRVGVLAIICVLAAGNAKRKNIVIA